MKRSPELDFLRGVSILIVMIHHFEYTVLLTRAGWAGVDMFFVLSGFLVAGLLLNEYKVSGKIRPVRFLIRRGFKIYPLFYFAVLFHLLYFFAKGIPVTWSQVLAELFFVQNYIPGLMGISWSLAVEEHFYFLLAILLYMAYRRNAIRQGYILPVSILLVCCLCFLLRVQAYYQGEYSVIKNDFPTHLRMDSLAFGVLLSYWFVFYKNRFYTFFQKHIAALLLTACVFLLPMLAWNRGTFIVSIFGHTLLYLSFGILMGSMIVFSQQIRLFLQGNRWLQFLFTILVRLGIYSFGIYLFHFKVGPIVSNWFRKNLDFTFPSIVYLLIYLFANIAAGILFSKLVEHPFLRIREKYLPPVTGTPGLKIPLRPKKD